MSVSYLMTRLLSRHTVGYARLHRVVYIQYVHLEEEGGRHVQYNVHMNSLMGVETVVRDLQIECGERLTVHQWDDSSINVSLVDEAWEGGEGGYCIAMFVEMMYVYFTVWSVVQWKVVCIDRSCMVNMEGMGMTDVVYKVRNSMVLDLADLNAVQQCSTTHDVVIESRNVYASDPDIEDCASVVSQEYGIDVDSIGYDDVHIYDDSMMIDDIICKDRYEGMVDSRGVDGGNRDGMIRVMHDDGVYSNDSILYSLRIVSRYTDKLQETCAGLILSYNKQLVTKVNKEMRELYTVYSKELSLLFSKLKIQVEDYSSHSIFPIVRLKKSKSNMSYILYCEITSRSPVHHIEDIKNEMMNQYKSFLLYKSPLKYSDVFLNSTQLIYLLNTKREFNKISEMTRHIYTYSMSEEERITHRWIEDDLHVYDDTYNEDII